MLYSSRFEVKKTIPIIKSHLEFRADQHIRTMNNDFKKILEEGIMYMHGRDKEYRPIIILNAHMIDLKKHTIE